MEYLAFIKEHFVHAAPILVTGVLSLAIVLERFYSLYFHYPMKRTNVFFEKIAAHVMKAEIAEATRLCDRHRSKPAAQIVKAALTRSHLPDGLIQDGVQLALNEYTQSILKRTSFLATTANVATLLGLFGTIAGLIQSFEAVAHADPQQKSALLSAGIATAMNATMLGLGVAIPCMVAFSFLTNRTNVLLANLEQAGIRSLDILKQRFYASELVRPAGNNEADKVERAA